MAAGAFMGGWQMGERLAEERRLRKQQLGDEQREDRRNELNAGIANLQQKYSSLLTPKGEETPGSLKAKYQLAQAVQARDALYNEPHTPNIAQRVEHLFHRGQPAQQPAVAPPVFGQSTMEVEGQRIPTGPAYMVQGPQSPEQQRAQAEAGLIAAGAPPQQNQLLAYKNALLGAGFSEEQAQRALEIGQGLEAKATPPKPETTAARELSQYDAAVSAGFKGSFPEWKKQQGTAPGFTFDAKTGQVVNPATGRRYSRTDTNLPPDVAAIFSSQKESVAEKQRNAIALAYARGAAFAGNRYVQVVDPATGDVEFMRAQDAAKAHLGTPASNSYKLDLSVSKAFTVGAPAQTITRFNTAVDHLQLLSQAADALQNQDAQLLNRLGNAWAAATGNPAPVDFETVKNAVAGELSMVFKGQGATDQEINLINNEINVAQSPGQLHGAIENNLRLMGSKLNALRNQYQAARAGQPNFPGAGGGTPMSLKNDANKRTFPNAPNIGSTEDGYSYIGGDPQDQRSWRKVGK